MNSSTDYLVTAGYIGATEVLTFLLHVPPGRKPRVQFNLAFNRKKSTELTFSKLLFFSMVPIKSVPIEKIISIKIHGVL